MDVEDPASTNPESDPYSRAEYRRLIAWDDRIRREGPFLRQCLENAPDPSVLDLGCGTGEHVAFFARTGSRAVGLDRSEAMIAQAREHEARGQGRFFLGDVLQARKALGTEPSFGLALCLGNMLPHLQEEREMAAFLEEVRALLQSGGLLLIQLLNYQPLLQEGVRHLPLNFRTGKEGEEIVFLRLLCPQGGDHILFFPTTLVLDPAAEEPVTVRSSRRVPLRAWTSETLRPLFSAAGFSLQLHGDMEGGSFHPETSHDLVILATREGP